MKTILKTWCFVLKEFSVEDAQEFYNINLDEEEIKLTGDVPFKSVEEAEEFINSYDHYQKYSCGRWTIIEKSIKNYKSSCLAMKDNTASIKVIKKLGMKFKTNLSIKRGVTGL